LLAWRTLVVSGAATRAPDPPESPSEGRGPFPARHEGPFRRVTRARVRRQFVVSPWPPVIIKEGDVPSDDVLSEAPCLCELSDRAVGSPDFGTLRPGAQQQQGMEVQPTQSRGSGVSGKPTCAQPLCSGIGRRRSAAIARRERRHSPLLVRRRKGAQPPEASFPDDRAVDLAVVFAGDGACLLTPPPPGRRP